MGRLVVFDGIDGSGKSTTATKVVAALDERDKTVFRTAFPTHKGPVGALIRSTFTQNVAIDERAMLHLFIADALDHDHAIRGTLREFDFVLLDRHPVMSGFAYQLETWGVEEFFNIAQAPKMKTPDHLFIFDVEPVIAHERVQKRAGEKNLRYEKDDLDYIRRLRNRYMSLYWANQPESILIDGSGDQDENAQMIVQTLMASS